MNQHIEIEYKNLLTKQDFERLMHYFKITQSDFFSEQNHYSTHIIFIYKISSALRIVKKMSP